MSIPVVLVETWLNLYLNSENDDEVIAHAEKMIVEKLGSLKLADDYIKDNRKVRISTGT